MIDRGCLLGWMNSSKADGTSDPRPLETSGHRRAGFAIYVGACFVAVGMVEEVVLLEMYTSGWSCDHPIEKSPPLSGESE